MMGARSVLLNLPVMMMMNDEHDDACLCLTLLFLGWMFNTKKEDRLLEVHTFHHYGEYVFLINNVIVRFRLIIMFVLAKSFRGFTT